MKTSTICTVAAALLITLLVVGAKFAWSGDVIETTVYSEGKKTSVYFTGNWMITKGQLDISDETTMFLHRTWADLKTAGKLDQGDMAFVGSMIDLKFDN